MERTIKYLKNTVKKCDRVAIDKAIEAKETLVGEFGVRCVKSGYKVQAYYLENMYSSLYRFSIDDLNPNGYKLSVKLDNPKTQDGIITIDIKGTLNGQELSSKVTFIENHLRIYVSKHHSVDHDYNGKLGEDLQAYTDTGKYQFNSGSYDRFTKIIKEGNAKHIFAATMEECCNGLVFMLPDLSISSGNITILLRDLQDIKNGALDAIDAEKLTDAKLRA